VFSIKGRGTVATGRIERGIVKVSETVEIVGIRETRNTVVTGVEMFKKLLDEGRAGDNVGLLLRGVDREEIERGEKTQTEKTNIIRRGVDTNTVAGDGSFDFGTEGGTGKGVGIGFGPGEGGGFGGFGGYLRILRQRIWQEWTQSAVYGSNQVCVVGLTVSRSGDVSDIRVEKPSGNSFYDSVAPLFVEYEDVLLRRAATAKTPDQSERWLVQVKETIETSHAAELQDYFQDDCVGKVVAQHKGGALPSGTMVVYPISFPDRLELLVETPTGLKQIQVPVSGEKLTKEIRTFRRLIQDSRSQNYMASAQMLHGWLVAPLQQDFQSTGISTLVVVAEGALRTIPMGALHDGRQFLVDTVAVAVTPSLEMTDLMSSQRRKGKLLSVGLTESVEGVPAPRHAEAEVQAIRTLYGGKLLMNKQFSAPSLEEEIKDQGLGIVHVASQTIVGGEANESFVLAHDGKISMDRLAQLVGMQHYRQQPLDLLTLSSCEIAAEDDRAALGLTGVAVKTGARTALASLWATEETTTTELVEEFYRQLQDPTVSKAVALQRAQQKILAQRGHSHPSFWSAFLLINNWM